MIDLNEIRKEAAPRGRYVSAEHIAEEALRLRSAVDAGVQAVDYAALAESINNTSTPKGDFAHAAEVDELYRLVRLLMDVQAKRPRMFDVWKKLRLNPLRLVKPAPDDRRTLAVVDGEIETMARERGMM